MGINDWMRAEESDFSAVIDAEDQAATELSD